MTIPLAASTKNILVAGGAGYVGSYMCLALARTGCLYFRSNVNGTLNLLDAMRAAAADRLMVQPTAAEYGNTDYMLINTPGGTRIRDRIHITDLCEVQLLALNYLDNDSGFHAANLSTGGGNPS
jgi:UDP-glucose 4-epimerase